MSTEKYQTRRGPRYSAASGARQNTGSRRRSSAASRRSRARRQAAAGRSRRRRTGRRMTRRQRRALVFRRRMALVCAVLLLVLCGIGIWNLRQQNHAPKSEYTISDACEAYRTEVEELADQYDMTEYVDLIMAVMMQESSGRGLDVMQSSEGQFNTEYPREPNGITDPSYSIACGIQELRHALILAETSGPRDISAIELALQGYNFGADSYFAFMKEQKEEKWSHESASEFARMASGGVMRQESDSFYETAGQWQYGDQYYPEHVLRYYPYTSER